MKALELKIPPAVIFLTCLGLMWAVDQKIPDWFILDLGKWLERCLLVLGVIIGLGGVFQFSKKSTSVDPLHPEKANKLVTTGIYQFSRNPMYFAMLIILISGFLKFGEPVGFIVLIFFIWYMNRFQIHPEERMMEQKFGKDYIRYKKEVRRWL